MDGKKKFTGIGVIIVVLVVLVVLIIIVFSIIANHVFLDGNKRTGAFVLDKLCEDNNNIPLQCNDDAIIDVVLKIATSEFNREDLSKWIFVNSKEEH